MSRYKNSIKNGFTIVEILIIAPVVILVIGAFISAIVFMTGDVLASRGSTTLAYNIQDALNRIEQDVRSSAAFLATNNITLTSPQGFNDDTTAFHNSDVTNGKMLILNTYATTTNPATSTRNIVYVPNTPNACASPSINSNSPVVMNIIYFVKNGTLWRRTVATYSHEVIGCTLPWQQPSCAPAVVNVFCKTQDVKLVEGIQAGGFSVGYYPTPGSTTENTVASDSSQTDATRLAALQANSTVVVNITATNIISGRTVTQTGTIRAVSPNNYTSATPDGLPILSSPTSVSITSSGATLGATITSNGGTKVTSSGTCWGTTANPTTNCLSSVGNLTALSPATIATGSNPEDITISADGSSVYVTNTGANSISMYSRNTSTGLLTALSPATIATGSFPDGITISADGSSVYTVNNGANSISMYSRNTSTGLLTALSPATIATGSFPEDITISADGSSVYAVRFTDPGFIHMYSRNTGTGLLTALSPATIATGSYTTDITISADGSSVYTVDHNSATISMYSRNTSTGLLTALSPATITTGQDSEDIVISADGSSVYTVGTASFTVSMYSRNTSTGLLTALSPATTGIGVDSDGITISADGSSVYTVENSYNTISMYSRNSGTGIFTQARTGIPSSTLIYYRGFATNNVGTGYSPDGTFFTLP